MSIAPSSSTRASVGGWTRTSRSGTTSVSCSSRLRVRRPRSSSAMGSPRRRRAPSTGSSSSSPTLGSYGSFVSFSDPDGNGWILQEVTARLPGRVTEPTTYRSARDLEDALRRAAAAHGEHEARTGEEDANWPEWYADYMVREHAREEL